MYQQLFGNSAASGANANAADALVAAAGAAIVREEEGCVSFPAFVMGAVPGTNMLRLVPFNVASALSLPGAGVYWAAATGDGHAIRLLHKQVRAPATGAKQKRAVSFVPLTPAEEAAGVIADLHEIVLSMYVKDAASRAAIIPPVYTFVRVVNYRLTVGDRGDTRLFGNASALDRASFADLNALAAVDKFALLFPIDGGQALPAVAALMPLADYLKTQPIRAADPAARRKEEKAILRTVAPPLPVTLLRSEREWQLGHFMEKPGMQALVLPPTGLPAARAGLAPNQLPVPFFASLLVSAGDGFVKEAEPAAPGGAKQLKLMGRFEYDVFQQRSATAALEHFRVRNVTLFADKFDGLGVVHLAWIERLLRHTPVPVQIITTVDVRETTANAQNRDPAHLCAGSPAGVVAADVVAVEWRLKETLERRAIPVTRALIVARYGAEFAKLRLLDDKRNDRTPEAWRATHLEPTCTSEANFAATGVLAFDVDALNQVPAEEEAQFWMLPLFALRTPPPMAARADPHCPLPADEQPLAVALTPAEGDAFVRAALPAPPKTLLDWMEADFITPRFLCFATLRRPAVAARPTLALAQPDTGALPAGLPADMNALRAKLIAQTVGSSSSAARVPVPAPTPAPATNYVSADAETGEPAAKRARVGSPPPPPYLPAEVEAELFDDSLDD